MVSTGNRKLTANQITPWKINTHGNRTLFLDYKTGSFDGRGNGDFLISHDIEDIIAVFDGRPKLSDEINESKSELRKTLRLRFKKLLKDRDFTNAVFAHMPTDETNQARAELVLRKLENLVS